MKGNAMPFDQFIEGQKTQFIIPVYQRNYDWEIKNCEQLFTDLIKLSKSERKSHFFGSIVTAPADSYARNRLVIDGQQRLTTISLLLLAGIKAVKNNVIAIRDKQGIERAIDVFLKSAHTSSERKIKLVPIELDREAYDKIYNNAEELVLSSKVTRNFRYFYEKLTKTDCEFTFDDLLNAIEKLQIISIDLSEDDDAQLIFESLNSTGLALTEADKIRNYLLMSLSAEEQNKYFKNYWQKIEAYTNNAPTMFLRDYLTIKQQLQRHVSINNLYFEWKKYMEKEKHNRCEELAEMTDYAQYYQQAITGKLSSKKLSEKMKHICNIDTDVINVFFMQFFKYAKENNLAEEEIYKVIDLIENYMARRIICGLPSNSLTQVFCALHKDVLRSIEENTEDDYTYFEILTHHILRRDGNYQLPRNNAFKDAILTRDAYHMQKPYKIFLFERLENSIKGERNDVAKEMQNKEATIEHIMPQGLEKRKEWLTMLGENYAEIKEKYLHTFANLTLTGINSELSNEPFEIKRDGILNGNDIKQSGYIHSKYRLTDNVKSCKKWTEEELVKRGHEIVDTFMRLYPMPQTPFIPKRKPMDEVSLEDETFSPTNRLLKGFRLFNEEYTETTWKDMMLHVIKAVIERCPDDVEKLYDKEGFFWTSTHIDTRYCTQLAPDRYVWTSMDNRSKLRCLRYLFEACELSQEELVLLLEFPKD